MIWYMVAKGGRIWHRLDAPHPPLARGEPKRAALCGFKPLSWSSSRGERPDYYAGEHCVKCERAAEALVAS